MKLGTVATMPETLILDGSSIRSGGQVTRIRAFLQRFRAYDPASRVIVLEEDGAVSRLVPGRDDLEFIDRPGSGVARAARRALWQNLALPQLCRRYGGKVYLHFSHYLPYGLPGAMRTIVGVANLQPFSREGRAAEVRFDKRLRLAVLERTILSSVRRAEHVIALSRTCKDVLVARGVDGAKIVVIPNGVEEPAAATDFAVDVVLDELAIPGEYVLYVSHFYRYKNFERLVRAYSRLPSVLQDRYALVLVGIPHHREYWDHVRATVSELRLESRVIMIPGLDGSALSALYRRCSVFVFPSLIENCPNILLEAMAHGAPVVTGNIAPMPEFGGDAAIYFDPLDEASIASSLEKVLGDASLRQRMARSGRERALGYSWDTFTRSVVDLYL
ncbi:MAG: glycosyltransferase family 4 protein [Zoogloeaceae bacterium]|nr:glycosyltransferase family 4 protein [Zoogloeaceae bacterium]